MTSAGFFCSHPTSCFWLAMLMARKPEWPSLSRSYFVLRQLFSVLPDPTKSTVDHSVVCSLSQSLARQQMISVMESPKGMYRRPVVAVWAAAPATRVVRRRGRPSMVARAFKDGTGYRVRDEVQQDRIGPTSITLFLRLSGRLPTLKSATIHPRHLIRPSDEIRARVGSGTWTRPVNLAKTGAVQIIRLG